MKKSADILFAGTAGEPLGRKLSKTLHILHGRIELSRFSNGELRLRLLSPVKEKICLVVQSTGAPVHDSLFELFLIVDTLKRAGAKKITAIIPYCSYSRQHKHFRDGEGVSLDIVFRTLALLGADNIVTVDFHNLDSIADAPLPIQNLSAIPLLAEMVRKHVTPSNTVVVSPDQGGIARAKLFATSLFGDKKPTFTFILKERHLHKMHHIKKVTLDNKKNVAGKTVILVDDICTSGKTVLSATNLCIQNGAKEVLVAVTHPDMNTEAFSAIAQSPIKKFFTTNSMGKRTYTKKYLVTDITKVLAGILH